MPAYRYELLEDDKVRVMITPIRNTAQAIEDLRMKFGAGRVLFVEEILATSYDNLSEDS